MPALSADHRRWAGLIGRALLVAAIAVPNVYLVGRSLSIILAGAEAVDWVQFVEASRRVSGEGLYEQTWDYGWRYSPVAAYLFGALAIMGTAAWRLLHLAAAVAMPRLLLSVVTLVSWPLWYDIETGNTLVFFLLAGAWALRGSNVATGAYLAGVLLVPRPLMLPLAVWLLWKRPGWRLPFVGLFVVHGVAVLATGWGDEWIAELLVTADVISTSSTNVGPSRFIGLAWMVIGVPLAAFLTWRGRVGWASLAISPYLLPYYLLMGLLELAPKREDTDQPSQSSAATTRYSAPPA